MVDDVGEVVDYGSLAQVPDSELLTVQRLIEFGLRSISDSINRRECATFLLRLQREAARRQPDFDND